jgi:hypothetical protein
MRVSLLIVNISRLNKRLAVVAAAVAAAGTGALVPSSAQAATYWKFQNTKTGNCLTGGDDGAAFLSPCVSGNVNQQWMWTGGDTASTPYNRLENAATTWCLATDYKTERNAVWTTKACSWADNGQRWNYSGTNKGIKSKLGTLLRSNPGSVAVYGSIQNDYLSYMDYTYWNGSHT